MEERRQELGHEVIQGDARVSDARRGTVGWGRVVGGGLVVLSTNGGIVKIYKF